MTSLPASGRLNQKVLRVFSLVLILAGIGGFVIPPEFGLTSGAASYNVFHLLFGALGVFVAARGERQSALFNTGFGAVDLYQAVASRAHLFPESYFRWRSADDVLHVVIGLALVVLGAKALGQSGIPQG